MERNRVCQLVQQRNLVSVANNTRWTRLLRTMSSLRLPARLKHVAWEELSPWSVWLLPAENYVEVVAAGPVHFREIEWLDFGCAMKLQPSEALHLVREAKLSAETGDDFVRVFGYRADTFPS